MENIITQIREELFQMQDAQYKAFHEKLIPTVNADTIIGVRTPQLRQYAKKVRTYPGIENFLTDLPHKYYEENNLHAFLVEQEKDFVSCIQQLDAFLPYVDNWATCDMMRPKCLKKHLEELRQKIEQWLDAEDVYMVRFGIGMLMQFFLEEAFDVYFLDRVSAIRREEYYINMMIAWYFATALAKQYADTVPYLEKQVLPVWIHNKTIQKAVESLRILPEQKTYLRTLRIKKN